MARLDLPPLPDFIKKDINNNEFKAVGSWDKSIVNGVKEGSRNQDLTIFAGSLLAKYDPKDWETICLPLLLAVNDKNQPPLPYNEVVTIYNNIGKREAEKRARQDSPDYRVGTGVSQSSKQESLPVAYLPLPLDQLSDNDAPIEWIWEGYLAKGHETLFTALWKAGKTTLIVQFLKALQNEQPLAGQRTTKCSVLILSEESQTIWARRRDDNNITLPIWVLSRPIRHKLNYNQWVELLEQMANFCKEQGIDLFIIDTLSGFWSVDNENDAARVSAALLPLNFLLEKNIAVLLVHHFRKSGGDEGTASRGSGQLGAAVDIIIEFSRLNSSDPNGTQRVIKTYSRFEESPREVVIDLINGEYQTIGTQTDVKKEEKLNLILVAFEDYPEGVTVATFYQNWNEEEMGKKPSVRTIQRSFAELENQNRIQVINKLKTSGGDAPIYARTNPLSLRQNNTQVIATSSVTDITHQPQSSRHDTENNNLTQSSPSTQTNGKEDLNEPEPRMDDLIGIDTTIEGSTEGSQGVSTQ